MYMVRELQMNNITLNSLRKLRTNLQKRTTRIRGSINRYVLLSYQNEYKSDNIVVLRKLIICGKETGQRKLSIKVNRT